MKNKSLLNRLITNDVSLMILSVLLALVIWFVINAGSDVESSVQINNVPINIELSDEAQNDGLRVFIGGDKTASVEVSGNRLIVGSLSAADIQVYALDTDFIKTPDYYNLELAAKKNSVKSNYSIEKITPSSVRIYVDRYKEKRFEIKDEIDYKVNPDYYVNSSMSVTTVDVSGPETMINKIDRVAIQGEMSAELEKETSQTFELLFLDKDGNKLEVPMLELSTTQIEVTIKPLMTKEINLSVNTLNAPQTLPQIKLSADKIKIAGEQTYLDKLNGSYVIGDIDFADLDTKLNTLEIDLVPPTGCVILSTSKKITAEIDLSDYYARTITFNSFETMNVDTKVYNVRFNEGFEVTVCGPYDEVINISADDIVAKGDFSGKLDNITQKDYTQREISFTFSFADDYKSCFVLGHYSDFVNISKK